MKNSDSAVSDFKQALNCINRAISMKEKEQSAYLNNRALIYKDMGNYVKAKEDLSFDLNDIETNNLGVINVLAGNSFDASTLFSKAIFMNPSRPEYYYNESSLNNFKSAGTLYEGIKKFKNFTIKPVKSRYMKEDFYTISYFWIDKQFSPTLSIEPESVFQYSQPEFTNEFITDFLCFDSVINKKQQNNIKNNSINKPIIVLGNIFKK